MSADEPELGAVRAIDGTEIDALDEARKTSRLAGVGTAEREDLSAPSPERRAGAAAGFDAAARQNLGRLADVLIPAADGMPAASEAGVADRWLDEVLRSRPDLADDLRRILTNAAGQEPAQFIDRLARDQAGDFAVLAVVVPGAYYMNPDIRGRIGYPGQQAVPIEFSDPPDYEEEGLLRSVIQRGPVFRPTPGQ